jgi:hypothetical protein
LKGKTISFVANAFIETDGTTPAKPGKSVPTQKKRREAEDDESEED